MIRVWDCQGERVPENGRCFLESYPVVPLIAPLLSGSQVKRIYGKRNYGEAVDP